MKRLLKDLQEEVSDPTTIYCDNLSSISSRRTLFSTPGPSTSRLTITLSESVSFQVKSNYSTFRQIWQTANIFTKPLGLDKLQQFSGALGLRHLDMPNLRGRTVSKDRAREQKRSGRDRDPESDDKFDFG